MNQTKKIEINKELLAEFERTIDTDHPDKGSVPIRLLGFGEISIVFEIISEKQQPPLAYKRLPIFDSEPQVTRHLQAYNEYNRLLQEDIGITIPLSTAAWVFRGSNTTKITMFCVQQQLPPNSFGHKIIHQVTEPEVQELIRSILKELIKIWRYNKQQTTQGTQVGIDGQISNWAVIDYNESHPKITPDQHLMYIDTSTPMYRKNGIEAMEAVLFLKSAPSFLRWLLKALFLQEVLDRYYDGRAVVIDLIANFYKEQCPSLIPGSIDIVNKFFAEEAQEFTFKSITIEEVKKYYQNDKTIWNVFQSFRRIDRFLQRNILHRPYDFYLPGKIKR